jgi:GT2 family glycosyltransferase
VPRSRITHFGGQSTRQVALKMFLHLYGSKVRFFRKHYGEASARAYKRVLKFTAVLRLMLAMAGSTLRPQKRQHYTQLHANYDALISALPGM